MSYFSKRFYVIYRTYMLSNNKRPVPIISGSDDSIKSWCLYLILLKKNMLNDSFSDLGTITLSIAKI